MISCAKLRAARSHGMVNLRTRRKNRKAQDIARKAFGTNLEAALDDSSKSVVTKIFRLTNKLMRTREKHQHLVQKIQKIKKYECGREADPLRLLNQRSWTTKLEELSVERWCWNLKERGDT